MEWTHAICDKCWAKLRPGQVPFRVIQGQLDACCFCGNGTIQGIYIEWNPNDKSLKCKGEHNPDVFVEI